MTDRLDHTEEPSRLTQLVEALSDFAAKEAELAQAEIKPAIKNAGIGSGIFGAMGAFLFHALWMLIITMALAIGWALDAWTVLGPWGAFTLGFLIAAILSLIFAAICAKLGLSFFKKVKKPEATLAEARATLIAISESLSRIKEAPEEALTPAEDHWRQPPAAKESSKAEQIRSAVAKIKTKVANKVEEKSATLKSATTKSDPATSTQAADAWRQPSDSPQV